MEKIKINMLNGTSLEKPLVTSFKNGTDTYVVLDNEMNGTMGLPIILVSKMMNDRLVMVSDDEWNGVKEVLRQIIGGNSVDYTQVNSTVAADDAFFRQLTLPVASFDALKNNYKPASVASQPVSAVEAPVAEVTPVVDTPVAPQVVEPTSVTPEVAQPMSPLGDATPVGVVEPTVISQVEAQPVMPEVPTMPDVQPVASEMPVQEDVVMPNASVEPETSTVEVATMPQPVITPAVDIPEPPVVDAIPDVSNQVPVDFTADKEAFLKACENMFDALVAKFNK